MIAVVKCFVEEAKISLPVFDAIDIENYIILPSLNVESIPETQEDIAFLGMLYSQKANGYICAEPGTNILKAIYDVTSNAADLGDVDFQIIGLAEVQKTFDRIQYFQHSKLGRVILVILIMLYSFIRLYFCENNDFKLAARHINHVFLPFLIGIVSYALTMIENQIYFCNLLYTCTKSLVFCIILSTMCFIKLIIPIVKKRNWKMKNNWIESDKMRKASQLLAIILVVSAVISAIWYGRIIYIDGLFLPISTIIKSILYVLIPTFLASYIFVRICSGTQQKVRILKTTCFFLFFYYIFGLACLLFAGGRVDYDYTQVKMNFIPFANLFGHIQRKESLNTMLYLFVEYAKNIALFFPLGILLPLLFEKTKNLGFFTIITIAIILICELLQQLASVGVFDIDDCFTNLLGAYIGYVVYRTSVFLVVSKLHLIEQSDR